MSSERESLSLQDQLLLDLYELNIPRENIYIDDRCTFTNTALSSYRRDGKKAERMLSFLGNF